MPDIKVLLPLLDDTDDEVYIAIRKKIMESGPGSIKVLENALDSVTTLLQHERIESIIFQLKISRLKDQLLQWHLSENKSLLQGWIIISSIQGIEISTSKVEKLIRQIVQKIWLELNHKLTSFEKIAIINNIFFDHYGFGFNLPQIHSVEYSFIDKILILKKGNIITLSALYAIIARQLNLPLMPINIKERIFLAYFDPIISREAFGEIAHPFLFFVDIAQRGKIIGIKEFDFIMKENKVVWDPSLNLTNKNLIHKILYKIKESYLFTGDEYKANFTEDLINQLEEL